MTVTIIAAMTHNHVLGKNNDLPWDIPEDLAHFKKTTAGKTVIMGKNTFNSIVSRIGKPLPKRRNVIISTTLPPQEGIEVYPSLQDALNATKDDAQVFIIGGAQLYKEAIDIADEMIISWVKQEYEGDVVFPQFDKNDWEVLDNDDRGTFIIQKLTRCST